MPVKNLLEALLEESRPVFECAFQSTAVNEVKLVSESPGVFGVIDLEFDVWWNILWLDWAKINTENLCFRVLIGKVDCPDPSPASFQPQGI
jgi:hypothetical protein